MTVRVGVLDAPGTLASLLGAAGAEGAQIGNIRLVGVDGPLKVRDIQMFFVDQEHEARVLDAMGSVENVEILSVTDEVLEIHRGGTIVTRANAPLDTLMDLRMVYTPGVAHVCERIAEDPDLAWDYTARGNKIAIVTNGTAVLGLGDIGPLASLPVMEGKAAILAKFVGVSAEPMLVESKDVDELVNIVSKCCLGYGAIQLEDIGAPECFAIERMLGDRLDVPVFHDDQHGTATVCVAGLISALEKTNRKASDIRAMVLGAGAAGSAIARFLVESGVEDVVAVDAHGAIYRGRKESMDPEKERLAEITNKHGQRGSPEEIIAGKNLLVGVSKPNLVSKEMVASMEKDPIVFALANPVSEISVRDARAAGAAVALDGRGMNNALAYPGLFRGALDARAKKITSEMMLAAAHALAEAAGDDLLPDMLDPSVHARVAAAVKNAWKP